VLRALAVGVLASLVAVPAASAQEELDAVVVDDPRLSESSALAVSPRDPDLLYTVNDSGHPPVVYVIDRSGGADSRVVGTTSLAGVPDANLDPEAMAVGADGVLWVGDIGDNEASRTDIALYALPAPGRGNVTVSPERYPLAYPGGLRDDAEALVADPVSGRMWVISKSLLYGSVFEVPDPLVPDQVNRLRLLPDVSVPLLVTDGTVLPGGDAAVLRTYGEARLFTLPDWQGLGGFRLPRQEQGEAITALPGPYQLLAGSEGTPTRIDRVGLPRDLVTTLEDVREGAPPQSTGSPGPQDGADDQGADGSSSAQPGSTIVMGAAAAALVAAAGILVLRRRRR